jgi:glutamate formiminotransferase/formiminotetrahydrofolate cyclodeaminase
MGQLVECVPNFSEGRDSRKIEAIAQAIASAGVTILNIDPGQAANRTVITFAGSPKAVSEAAFNGVKKAGEIIDMRTHHGTHPRIGATDVLPIVPISGISLEECAELARNLAKRIFEELGIPCYCYEASAFTPERKRLEVCRSGEYEGLAAKIANPSTRPDFGPDHFTETAAKSGATVIGARKYLIAVNFNLNTQDKGIAMEIAKDVRQSGRLVNGIRVPGSLKGVKAIGWYIEEYGFAQVSMNITDIDLTPLHTAFDAVCAAATARGVKVTGTEIIGLVPKKVLVDAGKYFGQGSDSINTAITALNLNQIRPFIPEEKIIESLLHLD